MEIKTFKELLIEELSDLYSAENQLVESLPELEKAILSVKLKEAVHQHLQETKAQVTRLKKAFKLLGVSIKEKKCQAMEGILKEASEIIKIKSKSLLKDVALIGAAQRVEHYEIAAYGTAKSHAKLLGLHEIAKLLEETEDEESAANHKLTKIAEGTFFNDGINTLALDNQKENDQKDLKKSASAKNQENSPKQRSAPAKKAPSLVKKTLAPAKKAVSQVKKAVVPIKKKAAAFKGKSVSSPKKTKKP